MTISVCNINNMKLNLEAEAPFDKIKTIGNTMKCKYSTSDERCKYKNYCTYKTLHNIGRID